MGWNDRPKSGERWRFRGNDFLGRRVTETRTVVDRTLGGDVIYVEGRFTRLAVHSQCTEAAWQKWQKHAKELEPT